MRRALIFLGVLLLALLAQLLFYYRGTYSPPLIERIDYGAIGIQKAPVVEFSDVYTPAQGTVVVDLAHSNEVEVKELRVLVSRLSARGYKVEYLESKNGLEEALKYADAYVVIAPGDTYSKEHIDFLSRFVEKRGRLLLVHDPTRRDSINSLSAWFGVIFDSGYLYNQLENEGNYQYVFVNDFAQSEITKGLNRVTMYVASSITSTGTPLAYTDENTYSSTQPKQRFATIAQSGNVLALGDLSFLLEPYNAIYDNNKLVSNIADFLASGDRVFHLTDYPYYLGNDFSVVYSEEDLIDEALKIKNSIGLRSALRIDDPGNGNALILGLYNSSVAAKYLDNAGIAVNDKLEIKGVGKLQKNGSLVIALTQKDGRRVLLIAADENAGIESALTHLSKLKEITLTDFVAYATYKSTKTEGARPQAPEKEEEQFPPATQEQGETGKANYTLEDILVLLNKGVQSR